MTISKIIIFTIIKKYIIMTILFESYELDFSNELQKMNRIYREFNSLKTKERESRLLDLKKILENFEVTI